MMPCTRHVCVCAHTIGCCCHCSEFDSSNRTYQFEGVLSILPVVDVRETMREYDLMKLCVCVCVCERERENERSII